MNPQDLADLALPVVRFVTFVANGLLFGIAAILLLVLRPSFAGLPARRWAKGGALLGWRIEMIVRASLVASAVATIAGLLIQSAVVGELRGTGLSLDALGSVLETSFGQWYALRLPLVGALAVMLVNRMSDVATPFDELEERQPPAAWWALWLALAAALLLTSSLSGHAAVSRPLALGLTNDLVHLLSGSVWFTGIVVLATVLPLAWHGKGQQGQMGLLAPTIARFGRVAGVSIGVVAVTGLVNSFLDVASLGDLTDSSYGQALLTKVWLFAWVLGLGAYNHFVLLPRLAGAFERKRKTTARETVLATVSIEFVTAIVIIATTALLTGLPKTRI